MSDTANQLTAETHSLTVDEDSLVYCRFGNEPTDSPPLLCLQHFRGTA